MTKPADPVKFSPPEGFEAALAELESIVLEMEAGQMPLEESLEAHKRGTELLQYCHSKLQDAQQQVRLLEELIHREMDSCKMSRGCERD